MIATDYDHDGCTLADRYVRYDALVRGYRCNDCGGRIVTQYGDKGWYAECGRCGGRDFIREYGLMGWRRRRWR